MILRQKLLADFRVRESHGPCSAIPFTNWQLFEGRTHPATGINLFHVIIISHIQKYSKVNTVGNYSFYVFTAGVA